GDTLCGRLPRLTHKDADATLPPARRHRPADLRDRHQGIVGGRTGPTRARARHPHRRLAARYGHLWWILPLSPRRGAGGGRVRDRARLREPVSESIRGIPTL